MAEKTQSGSAKIYQFPIKPRIARANQQAMARPITELPIRQARVEFGSGWYHDAAIHDAEPARRH